jgi:UTP:GlnB (protein PII) uridylyltransferase
MLVGSSKLEDTLMRRIIEPFIFEKSGRYIEYLQGELASRHEGEKNEHCDNIKECRGGLRDIEMLLLMYKAKHRVRDPLTRKFLKRLAAGEPEHGERFTYIFTFIEEHLTFLKNLRDLYRLKVAANDIIDREHLPQVAATMGYGDTAEGVEKLYNEFQERTAQAGGVIEELAADIVK